MAPHLEGRLESNSPDRSTPLLVLVLLLSSTRDHLRAQAPAITGTFISKDAKFTVAGGVAFNHKSSLDSESPVILVAISNTRLNVEAIGDFVDRRRAIEQLVKDDETPIVYLEFTPQGRWRASAITWRPATAAATAPVRLRRQSSRPTDG
jgi:hypothetical protein